MEGENLEHLENGFIFSIGLDVSLNIGTNSKGKPALITRNLDEIEWGDTIGGVYEFNDTTQYYVRPHFDLDWKVEEDWSGDKKDIEIYAKRGSEFIQNHFSCNDEDIAITYDTRKKSCPKKLSLHFVIVNQYTSMKELIEWKNKYRGNFEELHFDEQIYRIAEGGNKFRAFGGCKWDYYQKKHHTYDRLITHYTTKQSLGKRFVKFRDGYEPKDTLIYYTNSSMNRTKYKFDIPKKVDIKKEVIKKMKPLQESKESEQIVNEIELSEELQFLLENTSPDRWAGYNDWWKLGAIIYNEGGTLEDYIHYSKLSPKNYPDQEEACETNWDSYEGYDGKKIQKGTLRYWLKLDNKEKFIEYEKKFGRDAIAFFKNACEIDEKEFADIYYQLNMDKYAYCDTTGWYSFDNYNKYKLHKKIPMGINTSIVNDVGGYLKTKMGEIDLNNEKFYESYKAYMCLRKNLSRGRVVKSIVNTFLTERYYIEDLHTKLDENFNVVAGIDKLYDAKTGEYREIKRDDYICRNTGYKLPGKEVNEEARKVVIDFIKSIMPNDNMFKFILEVFGGSFFGNNHEMLCIMNGKGGNGKGALVSLIEKVVGDYYKTCDSTFITSDSVGRDRPNADLYNCYKKRVVMVSEPDTPAKEGGDLKMNINFMKTITGRDTIDVRTLFSKDKINFVADFTTFIQCNTLPVLNEVDDAIKRRIKVIDFPYKFCKDPDPNNPIQKKGDFRLKKKLQESEVVREMFRLLMQHHTHEADLISPPLVKKYTGEYLEENNYTMRFIRNTYTITKNVEDWIKKRDVWTDYQKSGREGGLRMNKFNKGMIENGFVMKRIGVGQVWLGLKRKPPICNIVDEEEM